MLGRSTDRSLTGGKPRAARWKARLLAAAIGFAVAALLFEVALRCVLFAHVPLVQRTFHRFRHARCYANWQNDEDYWKLAYRLGEMPPLPQQLLHPELGWISEAMDPTTLQHRDESEIRGRRPILLYGDSYAHCMTDNNDCFQAWLERSDLRDDYVLLNFGVCGYGLDQIDLLLTRTVDRYAAMNPIVIVGVFVDDDLDRAAARLRYSPKPGFELRDGRLVLDTAPVPSFKSYVAQHPIGIRSYVWRWLLRTCCLPQAILDRAEDDSAYLMRTRSLGRAILADIEAKLASRGLEHFYLLFQGEQRVANADATDWRDRAVRGFLHDSRAPHVSASRYLRAAAHDPAGTGAFFGREGPVMDHYLPRANEVVFEAMRDGVAHRFEGDGAGAAR
jgi:hypothetical protein